MKKINQVMVSLLILIGTSQATAQTKVSLTGQLNQFDQFIGSGIWDFGSCLGEDAGLPPVQTSPYISGLDGKEVIAGGLKFMQKIVHYKNSECESGRGYTVVRSSKENRSCLAASYNHFCAGAPSKTVVKTGVWDFGDCAGGDRNLCPGLGLSTKNGASVVYSNTLCASGKARCTVDSDGWAKNSCEIARYIHTCE